MKRRQSSRSEQTDGRGRRGSLKKDEEPEIVENPTCPILKKIAQAFVYAKKAVYAENDGDLAPGSRVIKGTMLPVKHLCDQRNTFVLQSLLSSVR